MARQRKALEKSKLSKLLTKFNDNNKLSTKELQELYSILKITHERRLFWASHYETEFDNYELLKVQTLLTRVKRALNGN